MASSPNAMIDAASPLEHASGLLFSGTVVGFRRRALCCSGLEMRAARHLLADSSVDRYVQLHVCSFT
jgi:hypothetical protein